MPFKCLTYYSNLTGFKDSVDLECFLSKENKRFIVIYTMGYMYMDVVGNILHLCRVYV